MFVTVVEDCVELVMPPGRGARRELIAGPRDCPRNPWRRRVARMASPEEPLSRSTVLGLFAMGVAVLVIANDFTALSVALPAIEHDLNSELSTVQWVINAYALTFG